MLVGVIGGIGPQATLAFFAAVLRNTRVATAFTSVHLLIDCNPTHPDINASLLGIGPSAAPSLRAAARMLESAGARLLVMTCNAAHAYCEDIRASVKIPMLDLIEATAGEASAQLPGGGSVGILATDGCLASGIYQRALVAKGLRPLVLEQTDTATLMQTLRALGPEPSDSARACLIDLASRLLDRSADLLIAACTEIPLVLRANDLPAPLLDPLQILATRCIEAAAARASA
jgi:aspartate racemase